MHVLGTNNYTNRGLERRVDDDACRVFLLFQITPGVYACYAALHPTENAMFLHPGCGSIYLLINTVCHRASKSQVIVRVKKIQLPQVGLIALS